MSRYTRLCHCTKKAWCVIVTQQIVVLFLIYILYTRDVFNSYQKYQILSVNNHIIYNNNQNASNKIQSQSKLISFNTPTSDAQQLVFPTNTTSYVHQHDLSGLRETQSIINEYVSELSKLNYANMPNQIIINTPKSVEYFPHLTVDHIISSLSNHKIWIGGDSTVENLLCFLLYALNNRNTYKLLLLQESNMSNPSHASHGFIERSLKQRAILNRLFNFDQNNSLLILREPEGARRLPVYIKGGNKSTYYKWMQIDKKNKILFKYFWDLNTTIYGEKKQICGYYPPQNVLQRISADVVIGNFDLFFCTHLLDIANHTESENADNIQIETSYEHELQRRLREFNVFNGRIAIMMQKNIDLENRLEEFLQTVMDEKDSKCLILFGANHICENKFYGKWNTTANEWGKSDELIDRDLVQRCLDIIGYGSDEVIVDLSNTTGFKMNGFEFCKYNTLTTQGSHYLSQRMYKWIEYKQKQLDYNNNNRTFKLLYWDQTKVTQNRCELTGDGRHYFYALPVKVEILINIVNKWC